MRVLGLGLAIAACAALGPSLSAAQEIGTGAPPNDAAFLAGEGNQEGQAAEGETGQGTGQGGADAAWLSGQEQAPDGTLLAPPAEDTDALLAEDPERAYHLAGVRSHAVFVPSWLVEAFGLAESPGVIGPSVGGEYTFRKNGLDIVASIWWGGYSGDGYVREEGDRLEETEYIKSTINMLWITVDFLPSYDINDWFAIYYGGGVGIGITFGDVTRTEAYRTAGGGWAPCEGAGDPRDTGGTYCEIDGGHYNSVVPREFAGVWPAYPELAGKFGFRFKPLRNLVIGTDFGVGLPSLFTVGGHIDYMF